MALNLENAALTAPLGMEFPGTFQELLNAIANYLEITGQESFNGINYGSTEPTADNRDKPWFRLDDEGNPIGWFAWNGAAWVSIPVIIPSGTTAQRPAAPETNQIYHDTDIDVTLRFTGSTWTTLAGSSGDIKFVKAATSAEALTKNPGWSLDASTEGRVLAGASSGSGGSFAYGTTAGNDTVNITLANLPNDAIALQSGWGIFPGQFQNGSQSPGVYPITTGLGSGATQDTGPINPDTQEGLSVLQPTLYRWCLVKD